MNDGDAHRIEEERKREKKNVFYVADCMSFQFPPNIILLINFMMNFFASLSNLFQCHAAA